MNLNTTKKKITNLEIAIPLSGLASRATIISSIPPAFRTSCQTRSNPYLQILPGGGWRTRDADDEEASEGAHRGSASIRFFMIDAAGRYTLIGVVEFDKKEPIFHFVNVFNRRSCR